QITPERQFQTARDRIASESSDDGFPQQQPRRSHWPIALHLRAVRRAGGDGLEVRPRREVPALTPEHPDQRLWIRLEGAKGSRQALRCRAIHGVTPLRPAHDHSCYWSIPLHTDCHTCPPLARLAWLARCGEDAPTCDV